MTFVLFLAAAGVALWSLGDYGLGPAESGNGLGKKEE